MVAGSAGAGGDTFARLIAEPLSKVLKQPVVVEPKAGANGLIACDAVAKAQGDGYTLLFAPSSAILINPVIHPKLPYDAEKDLVPVTQVGAAGILLVANPSMGFKNLADMVAYAKAHPGKLAYGSWGTGSSGHLAMEGIKAHYGLDMPHAPYKTLVNEVTDLIANNISVGFTDIQSPIPAHAQLADWWAWARRVRNAGLPRRTCPRCRNRATSSKPMAGTACLPRQERRSAIIDRLNEEINRLQKTDEVRQKIEGQNMIVPVEPLRQAVRGVDQEGCRHLARAGENDGPEGEVSAPRRSRPRCRSRPMARGSGCRMPPFTGGP